MRAFLQRVSEASVHVQGQCAGRIGRGILMLLAAGSSDTETECEWLLGRAVKLRIFEDDAGRMNHSLLDIQGSLLVVSQFTLYADVTRGNRPGFSQALHPEQAERLYNFFLVGAKAILGDRLQSGIFGANMQVSLVNDGPASFLLDSAAMPERLKRPG
ncbi:MAG: D-tyrosyl-tRNA(Tyr) deacylase [Spirochaetales bacterium]|nr:D-tyrosyl-tRNA(Tyr) deacylase [Spirochaetales bacterium]